MKGFEFYAGGIEDAILGALEAVLRPQGVRTFDTYSGELDSENLKQAIGVLSPTFPLILVNYTDGVDKRDPATAPVFGRSLHFRHDCTFAVICVTNDARGENARRRGRSVQSRTIGAYTMIDKAREILSGLRLKKVVDTSDLEVFGDTLFLGEEVLLTADPLTPVANEFIARIPNLTAYAVIFETCFKWSSPDRSSAGTNVSEFVLDVDSLNDPAEPSDNLPGVNFN
jgi:phage gp37-like protein